MKELTYEDWLENPTPRKMWVWDNNESMKKKYKVVYFLQISVARKLPYL